MLRARGHFFRNSSTEIAPQCSNDQNLRIFFVLRDVALTNASTLHSKVTAIAPIGESRSGKTVGHMRLGGAERS